ncbi:MAG: sugar ABC transporter ATP-binding protein [Candidatus Latescibacterota bacterium]|jgi:ribose transport system ATP-binding protein
MSILRVRGICRAFPGVLALQGVNLDLAPGEVLAVIGENGAGKSTLMKILAGVLRPDAGRIELDGRTVSIDSPRAASRLGISLIHQELTLCTNLSIAANLFLGREPGCWGLIDRAALRRDALRALARVGLDLVPEVLVGELSLGRRQLVEIARALSAQARILIMDEPTSSLTAEEAGVLFAVIRELRGQRMSVIYISHRLGEVRQVADRVTVLRDGRNAGELGPDRITHEAMVNLMVGRDLADLQGRRRPPPGEPALQVEDLVLPAWPGTGLRFTLGRGEILGLAGLVGAGRTELLRALFGVAPALSGRVLVEGREASLRTPAEAIRAGLALVPEDRQAQGVILALSVRHNIGLPGLGQHARLAGLIDHGQEQADAAAMVARLEIHTPGLDQPVQLLSGGNQQKVVLGKWLALRPRVLLLDEPTRGVDVGAKQELYRLIEELADQGVAILFASSDLEEILRLSDRVLVMHQGRLAGELSREAASEEAVMRLATG